MGADLIGAVLVIKEGVEPDWEAAHKWAESLTVEQLLDDRLQESIENYCPGDFYDFDQQTKEVQEEMLTEMRSTIGTNINQMKEIYKGGWRNTMEFKAGDREVFVLAETSWGDSPEGFDEMWFFIDSGAATAAGFEV